MGVDTKDYIETKQTDTITTGKILEQVREACKDWVIEHIDQDKEVDIDNPTDYRTIEEKYAFPRFKLDVSTFGFSGWLRFNVPEQQRQMFICTDITDEDVCDRCISLSLGMWGDSKEIMRRVLEHVKVHTGNRCWLDENDCDEFDPVEVDLGYVMKPVGFPEGKTFKIGVGNE